MDCMMKGKATLLNITSPDMMEECELIYEYSDYTPTVVMEDCVND